MQVSVLASKGGQSLKEAMKRAMSSLLSNDLQRKFNWTGTQISGNHSDEEADDRKKRAFSDFKCCLALQSELFM
jgi:hypothetical protein